MNNQVRMNRATSEERLRALAQQLEKPVAEIRARAHQLFERRGFEDGHALEDWLAAERELFEVPPVEMTEKAETIEIRVPVTGYAADELEVTALPGTVTVQGDSHIEATSGKARHGNGRGIESEHQGRHLFCQVALPRPIRPEAVTATLEQRGTLDPVLVIAARKGQSIHRAA